MRVQSHSHCFLIKSRGDYSFYSLHVSCFLVWNSDGYICALLMKLPFLAVFGGKGG